MSPFDEKPVYQALALPNEAIANGGLEILRAGVIDDELFVSARPAFRDAAQWGEVLADITRRLGRLYAAQTDLSEQEAVAEIEEAYAAAMGAKAIADRPRKTSARPKRKPPAQAKRKAPARAKKPAKKSARSPRRRTRSTER